jgi:hypothetical protein
MRAADRQLKSPGALGEPGLRRRNRQVLGGKKVTLRPVIQRLPAIVGSLSAYTVERDGGCNGPASRCSRLINSSFTMPSLWLGCVTEQADQTSARKGPSAPKLRGFCFCRGGRLLPQSKGTAEINSAPQRKSPSLSLWLGLSLKCKLLPRGSANIQTE